VSGAGLGTYTAALFSATSTPSWAAAPRALAARFAASSIASAAVVLGLAEGRTRLGRDLDTLAVAALSAELAATLGGEERLRRVAGVNGTEAALSPVASLGVTTLGVMAPLGLLLGSLVLTRTRSRTLTATAALGVLGGSLAMRIAVMQAGDASARRPQTSMRFAQGRPSASAAGGS
jgi:hypothetical protein